MAAASRTSATAPRKPPRSAPRKPASTLPPKSDAVAAETDAEPVAKEPDPDLPVAAPSAGSRPAQRQARAEACAANRRLRQNRSRSRHPAAPAPAPARSKRHPRPRRRSLRRTCPNRRSPRPRRRAVADHDQGPRPQGRGDARRTRHHAGRSARGADRRRRRANSTRSSACSPAAWRATAGSIRPASRERRYRGVRSGIRQAGLGVARALTSNLSIRRPSRSTTSNVQPCSVTLSPSAGSRRNAASANPAAVA